MATKYYELTYRVGRHIATYRKQQKISQEKLAEKTHIIFNTISNIERGIGDPKLSTLMSIAEALNIPLCELLDFAQIQHQQASDGLRDNIFKLITGFDQRYLETAFEQLHALYKLRK